MDGTLGECRDLLLGEKFEAVGGNENQKQI